MIQPVQYNVISFKSNSHSQPIEKALDVHQKLIVNGFYDYSKTHKTRLDYLYSEIDEFKEAVKEGNRKDMEEEIGDVIFDAILLADYYGIDPEKALSKTNKKLDTRIHLAKLYAQVPLIEYPFEIRMEFWEKAKKEIRKREAKGLDTTI